MKESNGGVVPYRKPLLRVISFVIFGAICIWALVGWFFGILVLSAGHGNAGGGIFVSWVVAFIFAMAVLMNDD